MSRALFIPSTSYTQKKPEKKETYAASIEQQGQDYDELMNRYRGIADRPEDPRISALIRQYQQTPTTFTPQTLTYNRSPELSGAFSNLSEYARTGGLSGSEISDLRARGISPIRAVYANAQRNIDRQRSLQGGYSPNYTAATAKMSRELSEQIANQVSNVNAGIAEMQQRGRLATAPTYASAAQRETEAMGDIDRQNAENQFRAAQFNNQNRQGNLSALAQLYGMQQNRELEVLGGMRSLYGTTPALPALYGQQGMQREELAMKKKAQDDANSRALMAAYRPQTPAPVSSFYRLGRAY